MKIIFANVLFFVTFYRITLAYPYAYISLIFSIAGFFAIASKNNFSKFFKELKPGLILILVIFFLYTAIIDLFTDAIFDNFSNSFLTRTISMLAISLIPAYFFSKFLIEYNEEKLIRIATTAFFIQLLFWLATFIDPSLKYTITSITGGDADSVNLREHNLVTRGFGISGEMNYTTPFMTTLVCISLLKNKTLTVASSLTQLVNSTLTSIAIILGVFFSRINYKIRIIMLLLIIFVIIFFGESLFPRLMQEFSDGDSRTINTLTGDHFKIINNGVFGHIFGEFKYTFKNPNMISSDIGWVNIYNYGGILLSGIYIVFISYLSFQSFGWSRKTIVWFLAGIILNTKGVLFGPNSYFFMTFIFFFMKKDPQRSKNFNQSSSNNVQQN